MLPRSAVSALLLLVLAACTNPMNHAADYDYRQKHPLVVEPRLTAVWLASADGALPPEERARLNPLAADYLRQGSGALAISVGAAGPDDPRARAFAAAIAAALQTEGLRLGELRAELVLADPGLPPGTALLRFSGSTVRLPDCDDFREGQRNAPPTNFGCATQRNLGAMVADPRDLLGRRDGEPASGARMSDVVEKYTANQATWGPTMPYQADSGASGGQ